MKKTRLSAILSTDIDLTEQVLTGEFLDTHGKPETADEAERLSHGFSAALKYLRAKHGDPLYRDSLRNISGQNPKPPKYQK